MVGCSPSEAVQTMVQTRPEGRKRLRELDTTGRSRPCIDLSRTGKCNNGDKCMRSHSEPPESTKEIVLYTAHFQLAQWIMTSSDGSDDIDPDYYWIPSVLLQDSSDCTMGHCIKCHHIIIFLSLKSRIDSRAQIYLSLLFLLSSLSAFSATGIVNHWTELL